MKVKILLLLFLFFLFYSCNSQNSEVVIEPKITHLPVKILIGSSSRDSSVVKIFVPQELELKNNYPHKIRHSKTYVSITGANISDYGKNPLYQMADSLVRLPGRTYQKGDGASYVFYAGYTMVVSNQEKDSLRASGTFAQLKRKREVYDLGGLEESSSYLNRKVPDSLKGFLHLDFYNFNTRLGFVENVPIQFR